MNGSIKPNPAISMAGKNCFYGKTNQRLATDPAPGVVMKSFKRRAFTLVEIMIVVLIIGILLTIAVPSFMKARDSSYQKSCISNLTEIAAAKEQWAMDNRKNDTDTPTTADLSPTYIKSWPSCPAAGTYTINNEATNPTCTIPGHSLTNVGG